MQNKETKQEQLSFHTENFRKRSRYTFVFVCMIAAFFVITVLNINTGNVHISVPKILRILFLHDGEAVEYSIIWKIRLPRILMAALLDGIHSFDVKEDSSYGIPFGRRNHDWIYLFCNYRFCGDICR